MAKREVVSRETDMSLPELGMHLQFSGKVEFNIAHPYRSSDIFIKIYLTPSSNFQPFSLTTLLTQKKLKDTWPSYSSGDLTSEQLCLKLVSFLKDIVFDLEKYYDFSNTIFSIDGRIYKYSQLIEP